MPKVNVIYLNVFMCVQVACAFSGEWLFTYACAYVLARVAVRRKCADVLVCLIVCIRVVFVCLCSWVCVTSGSKI